MNKFLKFLSITGCGVAMVATAHGENLYLRAGATGLGNGADWNNAWSSMSSVRWGSGTGLLGPGDTLWIAGGTYGVISPGASGTAGNRIYIKRARSADAACTSAAGWNSGFDSQVVVDGNGSTAVSFNTLGLSYLTIDGQLDSGIKLVCPNNGGASVSFNRGASFIELKYLDMAGPGGATPITMNGDNRCIDATAWNGSIYEPITDLLVSNCRLHGCVNLLWLHTVKNSIFEYCKMYDSAAANSVTYHANVCATAYSTDITWRYNDISNWQVEGIMAIFGGAANWHIYGNVWHDGMGGATGNTHRVLEVQDGTQGPFYFYNNTIVNILMSVRTANGGIYASGSAGRNNIYWNTGGPGLPSEANNLTGTGSTSTPFVNYAGGDYRLKVGASAINIGANLGAPYNQDMDGRIRGSDGAWDVGAYEFGSGGVIADTTPPTVTLSAPSGGTAVSNLVQFSANAADNTGGAGISIVTFYVDGAAVATSSSQPYSASWNSALVANGSHQVQAKALDGAGNQGVSGTVTITVQNPPPNLTSGEIGRWELDGETGAVVDSSVNGNTGDLVSGAAYGRGILRDCISLDGGAGYVRIPSSSKLEKISGAFSFAAWVNVSSNGSMQTIARKVISETTNAAPYSAYDLIALNSGSGFTPRIGMSRTDGVRSIVVGSPRAYGSWWHLAGTYDGANLRLYVNGTEDGSVAFSGQVLQTTGPLCIGRYGTVGEAVKGLIDDVRLYNRALSAAEVRSLASPPPAPLGLRVVSGQ